MAGHTPVWYILAVNEWYMIGRKLTIYFRQKKYNRAIEVLCLADYITTKEAAKNWGITDRIVVYHCSAGRIKEAKKWEIHGLFLLTLKNRLTDDIGAVE